MILLPVLALRIPAIMHWGFTREFALSLAASGKLALKKIVDRIDTSALAGDELENMDNVTLTRAYGAGAGSSQIERG